MILSVLPSSIPVPNSAKEENNFLIFLFRTIRGQIGNVLHKESKFMADFIGSTIPLQLGFMTNLANNGLAFAVSLGTTALLFPDYVTGVENCVALQTAADEASAAAKAAVALATAAREEYIAKTRAMAVSGRASAMTDSELATLGISRRSTSNSPVPAPVVAPALALKSLSAGSAVLTYSTPGASGPRQRPAGTVGVQVSLRPLASTSPAEAGVLQTISRTPSPVDTSLVPAGALKVTARFVTQTGLYGPWSDVINFTSQPT